jgi:class 3 adenylate cyclase
VHTAARICAVGHGGQIVLSSATVRAVKASLPAGVGLQQLGAHRLQGLRNRETLFQLEADGLQARFPPPRTAVESVDRPREPH